MDRTAKKMRRLKRWGLPLGVVFIILGSVMISNWGTSSTKSKVAWYTVYSQEINAIGILGIVMIGIGIVFIIGSFFAWIMIKAATPCPSCGGLLYQKSRACPYCKSDLDWGDVSSSFMQSGQQNNNSRKANFCSFCGTKIEAGDIWCKACGNKLTS